MTLKPRTTPILACAALACAFGLTRARSHAQDAPPPEKKDAPAPAGNASHKVTLADFEDAFLEVADKVRPGVVAIEVRHDGGEEDDEAFTRSIIFSGVVWDDQGTVVALGRELESATEITASPFEGDSKKVRFAGIDDETGVAVLKVEGDRKGLSVLDHGSSDKLRAGSFCISVGNPIGLRHSVAFGHIAATGRTVKRGSLEMRNLIQVALPVNPGDPGGLLADSRGRIVGVLASSLRRTDPFLEENLGDLLGRVLKGNGPGPIPVPQIDPNDWKKWVGPIRRVLETGSPFAQNMSVAIPVEEVANAVERVRKNQGKPWLGVDVRDVGMLDEQSREALGLETDQGVLVLGVRQGSPAARCKPQGLKRGDVVLSWDGSTLKGMEDLRQLVLGTKPGTDVKLEVQRKHDKLSLVVTIEGRGAGERTPAPPENPDRRKP